MDKWIDKLIDTSWFMKVVALVLALFLFDAVYIPDKNESSINVPGLQDTEVLSDVPVKSYYDTKNLVVSGVPDTVKVTIKGPKNILQPAKVQRNFEVYVDLENAEIGTERVPIKIRNISDKLKVTIEPAYATVNIQEKITESFKVDVEFNKSLVGEGFISEAPDVAPSTVKITGAKDVIEKISYVKATVDIKGPINETIRREAQVLVFDQDMNKLNVIVEPGTIEVVIPVKSLSKTVPIVINEIGTLPSNIKINSISLNTDEVKIFGRQDMLDKTDNVRVEIDVSQISGDTEISLPVIIPNGITEVNPTIVKATIDTSMINDETVEEETKNENRTFSSLPINFSGLANQYVADLLSPATGTASLTVSGKSDIVHQINASDFNIFLDLSQLGEGEHEVKINVSGPANINWKLATETAKITITEKEAL